MFEISEIHPTLMIFPCETIEMPDPNLPKLGTKKHNFLHYFPVKTQGVFGPGTFEKTKDILPAIHFEKLIVHRVGKKAVAT
jgi:hypothetical protein